MNKHIKAAATELTLVARELVAGKVKGPGNPDGTGPASGGPPGSGRKRGPCADEVTSSTSRWCEFYLAKDGNWYMELADQEYGESEDATTYGPFASFEDAEEYLDQFSNPGGFGEDDRGTRQVPRRSPNGRPVVKPRRMRRW